MISHSLERNLIAESTFQYAEVAIPTQLLKLKTTQKSIAKSYVFFREFDNVSPLRQRQLFMAFCSVFCVLHFLDINCGQ